MSTPPRRHPDAKQAEYLPISEHGLIGDLRSAALVGANGCIDWFCAPRFDSASVFGSILDAANGGFWRIEPQAHEAATSRQFYLPDTAVLVTRFSGTRGVVEVRDFMPVFRAHDPDHHQRLVRQVVCVRGTVQLRVEIAPAFDYGRAEHEAVPGINAVRFESDELALHITATIPLTVEGGRAHGAFELRSGNEATFVLHVLSDLDQSPPTDEGPGLLDATTAFWRDWSARSTYRGRWREWVTQSAITLKLLTHEPTGALVAAPTTSLPEAIGGTRNWDYRYVWVQDASFSLYALLKLGYLDEALGFLEWLLKRVAEGDSAKGAVGPLRVMYDIDGGSTNGEQTLDHWEGYRASRPVRIRNNAADQLQLDIYGELIDSVYLYDKYGGVVPRDAWEAMRHTVAWLQHNWQQPDEGIWEPRSGRQHNTFSRVMSWVALERMMRMARERGRPGDLGSWQRTRDAIEEAIFTECWNDDVGAFTQHAGSDVLDSALLLMPAVKFIGAKDPRFTSTLEAIERSLVADSLVFRYDTSGEADGIAGDEGTFSMCSFWYVEALTRAGRLDDARLAFEKMLTYANPVGLYSEEIAVTGDQVGNFPQAFTHLSLISAAINLDRALG